MKKFFIISDFYKNIFGLFGFIFLIFYSYECLKDIETFEIRHFIELSILFLASIFLFYSDCRLKKITQGLRRFLDEAVEFELY